MNAADQIRIDNLSDRIDRLTAERDAARAEVERLRDILRRLLDAFGTPATRETETNLSEAMTAYEAANMKDEAHVLRTSIEALRAVFEAEAKRRGVEIVGIVEKGTGNE